MDERRQRFEVFLSWWKNCKGDEKGESQVFLDRLFQAFGHKGILEAGATLEYRVGKNNHTSFADLFWPGIVLIEMKKRGENLAKHYLQAFNYWTRLVPNRPQYVVLCNFDEFWVYDLNRQMDEPLDRVLVADLPTKWGPLAFLFRTGESPTFGNDLIEVTQAAADDVAKLFRSLVHRGISRDAAQRFALQCVLAMFSEDIELLPPYLFTRLVEECEQGKESTYDVIGDLFQRMNEKGTVPAGRYKGVDYFNGGIFARITRIDLIKDELALLRDACKHDWSKVKPAIFGAIFEDSMDAEERHAFGAHFTTEADIQKIVQPTIVNPWQERINAAKTIGEFEVLLEDLRNFKVLDPACGSGNFLYVAYRELKRLEKQIMDRIRERRKSTALKAQQTFGFVSSQQFYGLDVKAFAVELAKVTLMIAKKLAVDELQIDEQPLPLDNLDNNIRCADALFTDWPKVDAIIGNPPYQSKNKMQQELGPAYISMARSQFPDVPGLADYCVYWFRKTHDQLMPGGRAGLVGTNTIRQNYSRQGGLDYIVKNDGTIVEAVSSQEWSGAAAVSVSIVNWVKGEHTGEKILYYVDSEGILQRIELDLIPSSLNPDVDVTGAQALRSNTKPKVCHQGQTHGHEGFVLPKREAEILLAKDAKLADVLFPYLIGDEMIGEPGSSFGRYVIDFGKRSIVEAQAYRLLFERIKREVLPDRKGKAEEEAMRNAELKKANPKAKVNRHHEGFYKRWWQLSYGRAEMLRAISKLDRYIVCGALTKRPIFEFVRTTIHPNAQLIVFPFDDDYSFGVLQSSVHWRWFVGKCSTMRNDFRYTSKTVFDTFPWPQNPAAEQVAAVAKAAKELHEFRRNICQTTGQSLRDLYRSLELPGENPLREFQRKLDTAVLNAYGFNLKSDVLQQLLDLNLELAEREVCGKPVLGPGLPPIITDKTPLVRKDAVGHS